LVVLKELIEARKITPVIDRTFPLSDVPEAIRYLKTGQVRGKVVITVKGSVSPLAELQRAGASPW
jgi:D-arabinose 1-dehydrogenase-like Zn-dependent alcohol dehydrogenase